MFGNVRLDSSYKNKAFKYVYRLGYGLHKAWSFSNVSIDLIPFCEKSQFDF